MSQTLTPTPETPTRDVLTQAEAIERAGRVTAVDYSLRIDLQLGQRTYRGDCTIDLLVRDTSQPLFIDFKGGRIDEFTVNGSSVVPAREGDRIIIPAESLAERMRLGLRYENAFDTGGDGLHRFVDPEDGQEYLYSNFQPFSAHRLFPCFDQPDIKGTYELTVDAPTDWQVVSSDRPSGEPEALADGRLRHSFQRTPPFSTYLLALVAGPYHVIRRRRPDGIELGLYCRRSLAEKLAADADEIFQVTEQGFDFYAELFHQSYPFAKYDQLFMPEFNIGAMENVGAVTFSENFVFRDPATESQRQDRGEVILHELAHMWFGNLVTMRWWDDLWLNESFASYVSYLALTEATRFKGAWRSFTRDMKRWAYHQDQLPTTHPIAGEAPDTDSAFLNFDGITYGKGASVLKQLVATIGRDGFRDGLRLYFRRHAWGNATLAEFLAALEEGSGHDLGEWSRLWLETASVNTIAAEWTSENGRIASLELQQTAPDAHPVMRPHTLWIGLLEEERGGSGPEALKAAIDGPTADVDDAIGRASPVLVFPNHEDHAYAKVRLDPISLRFVRERLREVEDPLLRELLWMSLWEMVRDGDLPSVEYLSIIRRQVVDELDPESIESILARAQATLRWFVPEDTREEQASRVVQTALSALPEASDDDARIAWLRGAIGAAARASDLEPLLALADGTTVLPGVNVDQQMRWDLAIKAVAFDVTGAEERVASETARDASDRGERARIRATAARSDAAAKQEAWQRIHGEGYGSFHLTRAAMQGFLWPSQVDLLEPFQARFFAEVRGVFASRDHPFAEAYMALLFPDHVPHPDMLARAQELLEDLPPDQVVIRRALHEKLDDLARALRVRAVAEAAG
ncbi:MAG: aminopeptidase N [Chloroflexi bacterium]|nr:aminopeptidase N [Chloroflexota bacterium]MBA3795993.1 aminopeptidase N [Chloroflexota bacterium]